MNRNENRISKPWSLLLALALLAVMFAAGPARAAVDRVTWSQLPYYMESRGLALNRDLPLCDCPLGLNENQPSHQVLQVIANTLYEWREYTFTDSQGQPRLAVSLLQPEKKPLSADAARILLTASAGWRDEVRSPAPARSAAEAPEFSASLEARGFPSPETTIRGGENRVPVPFDQLTQPPYNDIAQLIINDGGNHYRGTGFLIAPYCVLTAGHNIWWENHVMDSILVAPAYYRDLNGSNFPYGVALGNNLQTNSAFTQYTEDCFENPTPSDFGAILLDATFNGIATYIPLEFRGPDASLPSDIMVAGYPLYVPADNSEMNYNMYLAPGQAGRHTGNWELIDYNVSLSSGNDGSPILYQTESGAVRAIGIVTTGRTGVLLNTKNMGLISSWMDIDFDYNYTYYIPYYHRTDTIWTGLALANPYNAGCHIKVEYYTPSPNGDGDPAGARFLDLAPGGQFAFACESDNAEGWIKILSTGPIYGLALVGEFGTMSTMFDMDLKEKLHKKFLFPHLASLTKEKWTSTVMLCNPNPEAARLNLQYFNMDGEMSRPAKLPPQIPAHGSIAIEAGDLFGKDLNFGSLVLQSTQPLAAFLLYDNTATGTNHWKAGLSAVPLDN